MVWMLEQVCCDEFVKFINQELAPRKVNVLILRIDFNYQFESHPELRDSSALTKEAVKKMVQACRQNQIRFIPQINLLGHQSWASKTTNLLRVYPQFDETPNVKMHLNSTKDTSISQNKQCYTEKIGGQNSQIRKQKNDSNAFWREKKNRSTNAVLKSFWRYM